MKRRLVVACQHCGDIGGDATFVGVAEVDDAVPRSIVVFQVRHPDASSQTLPPGAVALEDGRLLVPVSEERQRFQMKCPTCIRTLRPRRDHLTAAAMGSAGRVFVASGVVTVERSPAHPDPPIATAEIEEQIASVKDVKQAPNDGVYVEMTPRQQP